ncbi:uncharacterized protein PV07_12576 [Cladophialophora immunda]|uniref:Uncharacterized protein n=1 Tax=Cladophialophora immunda TaxID=569365 RepID=A0A0D2BSM9_9EURO|nr:uncharacterized protein PV07_12576 [Cladophialophora immunda]KIW22018.1 hypothetical protein PV07_12576 [Cladophialophora immunda]
MILSEVFTSPTASLVRHHDPSYPLQGMLFRLFGNQPLTPWKPTMKMAILICEISLISGILRIHHNWQELLRAPESMQHPLPDPASPSTASNVTPRALSLRQQPNKRLTFIKEEDWDPEKTYDEDPPICLRYSIKWTVTVKRETLNRRHLTSDTELDVVLAPGHYWERCLKARLADLVKQKFRGMSEVRPDDTNVVVSVKERSQPDLIKRFPGIDIDWKVVQTRLEKWGQYFQTGKSLLVNVSFNYIQVGVLPATNGRTGDKRGRTSTTRGMLNELDVRVDAEEATSGQSNWRKVYGLMRCPGSPCPWGRYCWIDPVGKKHYRLLTHHLKDLVRFVERRGRLETHDDVPQSIRQQLYDEEKKSCDRKSDKVAGSPGGSSAVTINILSGHAQQAAPSSGRAHSIGPVQIWDSSLADDLDIEGPRDVAVREFSEWLQARYQTLHSKRKSEKPSKQCWMRDSV